MVEQKGIENGQQLTIKDPEVIGISQEQGVETGGKAIVAMQKELTVFQQEGKDEINNANNSIGLDPESVTAIENNLGISEKMIALRQQASELFERASQEMMDR